VLRLQVDSPREPEKLCLLTALLLRRARARLPRRELLVAPQGRGLLVPKEPVQKRPQEAPIHLSES
jgi:hypothetical protein